MKNTNELIAVEICRVDEDLIQRRWLAEESSDLALRFSGLDDMPLLAVLPLAHLAASGMSDERGLALATGIDPEKMEEYLENLCEFKFVKQCLGGYEATAKGMDAFGEIGKNFIIRKRLEMKSRFEHLDHLLHQMGLL